jgi:hypothetical protein
VVGALVYRLGADEPTCTPLATPLLLRMLEQGCVLDLGLWGVVRETMLDRVDLSRAISSTCNAPWHAGYVLYEL